MRLKLKTTNLGFFKIPVNQNLEPQQYLLIADPSRDKQYLFLMLLPLVGRSLYNCIMANDHGWMVTNIGVAYYLCVPNHHRQVYYLPHSIIMRITRLTITQQVWSLIPNLWKTIHKPAFTSINPPGTLLFCLPLDHLYINQFLF